MSNTLDGYGSQFYPDQNVLARDLNLIGYANTKSFRDYLKAVTFQRGVVMSNILIDAALSVSTDGTIFTVAPGTAIDALGRIICVPVSIAVSGSASNDPLYYPARPARAELSTDINVAGIYYINLNYTPLYADIRYDDGGSAFNTRVYDSYTISVDSTRTAVGVTLAQVQCNASGSIIADGAGTGYYNPDTGVRYALYDDRTMFEIKDGRIGDLVALTSQHETDLNEDLDKSVGFLYPTLGHAFYSKISRNVTIKSLDLFCTGTSGNITIQLYSGSSATALNLIGIASTTPNVWTSHNINIPYYEGHILQLLVAGITGNITECTASLIYNRR